MGKSATYKDNKTGLYKYPGNSKIQYLYIPITSS